MYDSLIAFLPPDVTLGFALLLIAASAFTSALTASLGLGGGIALLSIMALGLPVPVLIPVHGIAQFGSNFGRALIQRAHIDWRTVLVYKIGMTLGALIGALFVVALPEGVLKLGLAFFILWTAFGTMPKLSARGSDILMVLGGFVSTFASMFFGATGPITMGFLAARGLVKHRLVATHAATMVLQHALKATAFGVLGFSFLPWLPLLAAIIAAGFLGTLVGSSLLDRLEDRWFALGLRLVMTFAALSLLYEGSKTLFSGGAL